MEKPELCRLDRCQRTMIDSEDFFDARKKEFAAAFPDYLSETSQILDAKHSHVIGLLSQKGNWLVGLKSKELRSWAGQNDLGAPINARYVRSLDFDFGRKWLKFCFELIFRRKISNEIRDSILDDIEIIKLIGGEEFLLKNPVNDTPGNPIHWTTSKFSVNTRWLRYIYLATRMRNEDLFVKGGTWVDIGSYYGGLQSVVAKSTTRGRIVLVDFHHQLFRSFAYLKEIFPNATHDLGGNQLSNQVNSGLSFHYIHVASFSKLSNLKIDLLTNFFSFGEMKRDTFQNYCRSQPYKNAKSIYLVNRFVSAPFFDPTYDSDLNILDYLNPARKITYFDIFPIHYFSSLPRFILGRNRRRNISSPYFEMILSPNDCPEV